MFFLVQMIVNIFGSEKKDVLHAEVKAKDHAEAKQKAIWGARTQGHDVVRVKDSKNKTHSGDWF